MAKQRLDLVEDTLFWLIGVILNGQESLKTKHTYSLILDSVCGLKEQMPSGDYRRETAH